MPPRPGRAPAGQRLPKYCCAPFERVPEFFAGANTARQGSELRETSHLTVLYSFIVCRNSNYKCLIIFRRTCCLANVNVVYPYCWTTCKYFAFINPVAGLDFRALLDRTASECLRKRRNSRRILFYIWITRIPSSKSEYHIRIIARI